MHTDAGLGDLLGQAFVKERFGGASKQAAEQQIQAIVAAMTANLDALPWMDKDTKVKAHDKLTKMAYQIGFPKRWRNYSFAIDAKTWAANAITATKAEH